MGSNKNLKLITMQVVCVCSLHAVCVCVFLLPMEEEIKVVSNDKAEDK